MVKEYFSHDVDALSDIKIVKMMQDYNYTGFGWYWAIVAELCRNGGMYELDDLGILAKNIGIKTEQLKSFINKCINNYTHNGKGLFNADDKNFWSDSLKKRLEIRAKRSEARKITPQKRMEINGIEFVNITEEQYQKAVEKFEILEKVNGKDFVNMVIKELDDWLAVGGSSQKKYLGKNHNGFLRDSSWVVNKIKDKLGLLKHRPNWSI